jgi:hypothetical protein
MPQTNSTKGNNVFSTSLADQKMCDWRSRVPVTSALAPAALLWHVNEMNNHVDDCGFDGLDATGNVPR